MRKFVLKNICECSAEQQMKLLDIRNSDAVRKAMYTEHIISPEEHRNYIEKLKTDKKQQIFIVLKDGETTVGMLGLNRIDTLHKKCDWAFYLDPSARGGIGSALEVFTLDFVFSSLGMEKLNCEVLETNPMVVNMHKKFGFKEEGFRASNVEKDGTRIGVHFLGLTKSDWDFKKKTLAETLAPKIADIEIRLADTGSLDL